MIEQKDKVGLPTLDSAPTAAETGQTPVPGVIYPRCPHCPTNSQDLLKGPRPGDPQKLWRLRYDFPDGVVAEVLFCGDCRATISALVVGYTPAAKK